MRKALDELFDTLTYSLTHGMRKQHKAIIHDTLSPMDVHPNNSVHVGDDYAADIIGTKNAGMYTVHLQRENKQQAPEADWIVSNLEELENIFSRYSR